MKYYVKLNHYVNNSGYSFTETFETGTCAETFEADEWVKEAEFETEGDDGWIIVDVLFYDEDDDPLFDNPRYVSRMN